MFWIPYPVALCVSLKRCFVESLSKHLPADAGTGSGLPGRPFPAPDPKTAMSTFWNQNCKIFCLFSRCHRFVFFMCLYKGGKWQLKRGTTMSLETTCYFSLSFFFLRLLIFHPTLSFCRVWGWANAEVTSERKWANSSFAPLFFGGAQHSCGGTKNLATKACWESCTSNP